MMMLWSHHSHSHSHSHSHDPHHMRILVTIRTTETSGYYSRYGTCTVQVQRLQRYPNLILPSTSISISSFHQPPVRQRDPGQAGIQRARLVILQTSRPGSLHQSRRRGGWHCQGQHTDSPKPKSDSPRFTRLFVGWKTHAPLGDQPSHARGPIAPSSSTRAPDELERISVPGRRTTMCCPRSIWLTSHIAHRGTRLAHSSSTRYPTIIHHTTLDAPTRSSSIFPPC